MQAGEKKVHGTHLVDGEEEREWIASCKQITHRFPDPAPERR